MSEQALLGDQFETNRTHLRAVAYRMLGSLSEADDAVQETWLRLHRSGSNGIENLSGWLTTVLGRVCIDMLRAKKSRREETLETQEKQIDKSDPEEEASMADSVGIALLILLDSLNPAERLAFVLHEMFDVSFDEIASILGRTPAAARQLASRARRRVRGNETVSNSTINSQAHVVSDFLAALQAGDFEGLLAVLDPDVVVRAHMSAGVPMREVRGASKWAKGAVAYSHLARMGGTALIDGTVGLVYAAKGRLSSALIFKIDAGKILQVDVIRDSERLSQLKIALFE